MNKLFAIILIFGFIPKSFACICAISWDEWNEQQALETIEYTAVIFIGELKTLANGCYEFEVLSVFSGNVEKGNIVTGNYLSSCSNMPYRNGTYIIYGEYHTINDQLILDYSQCSPSRKISGIKTKQESEYLKKEFKLLNECFDKNISMHK